MALDFYMSEMSVSDHHGGGLTLQRVLGDELDRIKLFAHVSRFASEYPVAGKLKPRTLDLPFWPETQAARTILGCRPMNWIARSPMAQRNHGRRCAMKIAASLMNNNELSRGLICPQGALSLYATEALARLHCIEYVTWVMDDHLVRWRSGAWHYPPGIEPLFARHLQKARHVFVISPTMGEFYRERFRVNSSVLFGPTDWVGTPDAEAPPGQPCLRLGYFGAVGTWQIDALALLARNLVVSNASLDIYSGRTVLPPELQFPNVHLRNRISATEVVKTMSAYDAVVLPISFRPEMRHMTEFNIATKMSECLGSGTVTLALGPAYSAMVRYLQSHKAAVVVTEPSDTSVCHALTRLRKREARHSPLEAARHLVENHLSTVAMRAEWNRGINKFSTLRSSRVSEQ